MPPDGKQANCDSLFLIVLISADPPLRYVNLSAPLSLPFPHHNGAQLAGTKVGGLMVDFHLWGSCLCPHCAHSGLGVLSSS